MCHEITDLNAQYWEGPFYSQKLWLYAVKLFINLLFE